VSRAKKSRAFQFVAGLLACHLVPYYGALIGAPLGLVLSCYLLALVATFGTDWLLYEARP